jgi:hypothetical protein
MRPVRLPCKQPWHRIHGTVERRPSRQQWTPALHPVRSGAGKQYRFPYHMRMRYRGKFAGSLVLTMTPIDSSRASMGV